MTPTFPIPRRGLAAAALAMLTLAGGSAAAGEPRPDCRFFEGLAFREASAEAGQVFFGGLSLACLEAAAILSDGESDDQVRGAASDLLADLTGVREIAVEVMAQAFAETRQMNRTAWSQWQELGVSIHTVYFIARDAHLPEALEDWQLAKAAHAERSKS